MKNNIRTSILTLVCMLLAGSLTAGAEGLPPRVTFFAINNGAALTSDRTVTLNNNCWGAPTMLTMTNTGPVITTYYYMASENATFGWSWLPWTRARWLPYSKAPSFKLSSGNGTKTVYFKVKNAAGEESPVVHDTITLNTVKFLLPPTIVSFTASPSTITAGQNVTLSWQTTGATSVSIDHGIGSQSANGSKSANPGTTTTYMLTAMNAAGSSVTATAKVTVVSTPISSGIQLIYAGGDVHYWSSLALDSQNNPHVAFLSGLAPSFRVKYIKWDAVKGQWGNVLDIGDNVAESAPALAIGPDDVPHIAYLDTQGNLKIATHVSGPSAWSFETAAQSVISWAFAPTIDLIIDGNNIPHVLYGAVSGSNKLVTDIVYRHKQSQTNWYDPLVVNAANGGGSFARDSADIPHVGLFWGRGQSDPYVAGQYLSWDQDVIYSVMSAGGFTNETAGYIHSVEGAIVSGVGRVSVGLDAEGNPHLIAQIGSSLLHLFKLGSGSSWNSERVEKNDLPHAGCPSMCQYVSPTNDELTRVAYFEPNTPATSPASGWLRLVTRSSGVWLSPQDVDRTLGVESQYLVGEYPSMAVNKSTGKVIISYYSEREHGQNTRNLKLWVEP